MLIFFLCRADYVCIVTIMNNEELNTYLNDYWEFVLKTNPTFATYIGDHRYNKLLEDLSEQSIASQAEYCRALLIKVDNIDAASLSTEQSLNHNLLSNTLQNHIRFYTYNTHYLPINHMSGPHIDFPQIIEYHPFNVLQDYESYISRLKAFPTHIDQLIALLKKGAAHKITAFGKTIEHVLAQVNSFTTFTADNHPLHTPVNKFPDTFSENDKNNITAAINDALTTCVTPTYQKLYEYINSEYLQHCRINEGIWSLPDGTDMYKLYTRYHTTTDMTPEEIHNTGKSEVSKISITINTTMQKVGFNGSVREFADYIKNQSQLYPASRTEILDGYREILSEMDRKLPEYFSTLPTAKYDMKEIEEYREQAAPAAYYYPPPKDFSRPGYFYVNTYKPEQRPKYGMEALAYHEAVPGHHLQIAIMQELKGIPEFRRYEGSTAFIEGWALYAEKLAGEMGFYQDDYSEYGRLTNEIWRAARLVVDTGIHYFKWTRDQAIHYCLEHTGLEEHEIEIEIDRYIAMPGQALSYKVGELKILELREKAQKKAGSDFDITKFHDALLSHGALPLYILEEFIK